MQLVSIESYIENEQLRPLVAAASGGINIAFWWTSGSDFGTEGKFRWAATGEPFSFTNWDFGQPSQGLLAPFGPIENAVVFVGATMKWWDYPAFLPNVFVCEMR